MTSTEPTSVPWPKLREDDQWLIDGFEEQLRKSSQSPEELRARARELRSEAAQTDIRGYRNACLALASRYEEAAATRVQAP